MGAIIPALATVFAPAAATTGAAVAGTGAAVAGAGAATAVGAGAAAAGATAAGAGLGGALGSGWLGTIAGGVVSGIGAGMMASKQAKEERQARAEDEQNRRDEEQRRRDSYVGAGKALRFWEQDSLGDDDNPNAVNPGFQRADATSNADLRVGQREQPNRLGEKFRNRKASRPERFRYDRNVGQIVPA